MSARNKTSDFLRAMNPDAVDAEVSIQPTQAKNVRPAAAEKPKGKPATRAGLKHIGGYFDRDLVEKVAVLRARLDLDNSELIKLAIEDLHRKHSAKRAFGDA